MSASFLLSLEIVGLGFFGAVAATACSPVGEPIVRPELYNAGQIVEPDAGYVRLDCNQSSRLPATLALYCFDEDEKSTDTILDSTGKHDAVVISTKTSIVRGPTCCGLALQFSETNASSYLEIADSPDWEMSQGSISLWLRVNACPLEAQVQGIVSRASSDRSEKGHIAIFLLPGCNWSVYLANDGLQTEVRSGTSLAPGQWSNININFGPPGLELYLDGELVAKDPVAWGTAGNNNPWVVGADSREAKPGSAVPPAHFLTGAAIDLLRISSARNKYFHLE